jgi:predicted acyltransferase
MSSISSSRVVSLDQFRGYSVAAMFVVNFLGGLAVTHHVLKHNNTHFSYADSIMPSFIFICGFSYRMSMVKRVAEVGVQRARWSIIQRSLALILLSLILTAFNSNFKSWNDMTLAAISRFIAELFKANLWEVLAIIGAIQIMLLPWVCKSVLARAIALLAMGCFHALLSWSFNYDFVYGRPNWMDAYFGAASKRAWDGGFFGLISWAEIMLLGTIAFDLVSGKAVLQSARRLVLLGTLIMIVGYGLSCLTRLYDTLPADAVASVETSLPTGQIAVQTLDPVWPPWERANGRDWKTLLAEAPMVPPPPPEKRQFNYWMMDKRVVTQSFVLFSSGFAMALFGCFRYMCDGRQASLRLFDVFGKNPLAAYIIHHLVQVAILSIVPKDSSLGWSLVGLTLFYGITWLFVNFLDHKKLYLRL